MDVSLVIPAHNEEDNLDTLLRACLDVLAAVEGSHEILLIDDGSSDGTRERLREWASREPAIRPIHHPPGQNIGCHPSELEGLRMARGDVALFLPADLQILPDVLPAFLEAAEHADVVASNRVQRADARWRRVLSALNNRVERAVMGVDVHDAHSSMLLNRRALDTVVPLVRSNSALIPAELLVRARMTGLRIAEVDIPHHPRTAGRQTGATIGEIVGVQMDLLLLRRRLATETRRSRETSR